MMPAERRMVKNGKGTFHTANRFVTRTGRLYNKTGIKNPGGIKLSKALTLL